MPGRGVRCCGRPGQRSRGDGVAGRGTPAGVVVQAPDREGARSFCSPICSRTNALGSAPATPVRVGPLWVAAPGTQARSRTDEQMTVVIVLALGVLLAPTQFGHGMVHVISELTQSISDIHI